MRDLGLINNPHQDDKVIDACSIFGAMDISGKRFSGEGVIKAIANMHDRGNGLGGGFGVYGIYPEYAEFSAFMVLSNPFDNTKIRFRADKVKFSFQGGLIDGITLRLIEGRTSRIGRFLEQF